MSTATALTTYPAKTDDQHDRIYQAFQYAAAEGWLKRQDAEQISYLQLQPDFRPTEEWEALEILVRSGCRAKLKKAGIEFVTKAQYQHRLQVEPQGKGVWTVRNLTRDTAYTVTARGFALDCTCDEFGNGFCKHRDAVDEWKAQNPLPVVAMEPKKPWVDDTDATAAMLEVMGEIDYDDLAADLERAYPSPKPITPSERIPAQASMETFGPTAELLLGFTPTADQWAALEAIKAWWNDPAAPPFFRLQGYAGTGKSTIIQAFIQWLRDHDHGRTQIGFTAPTNQAVKVQARMLDCWGIENINPITCAKLFAIKEKKVEGKQVFIRDRNETPAVELYDLVVADECSMVSRDLWGYFLEAAAEFYPRQHRFILMGDPAQLPPVGEGESMSFTHACPSHELTQVMRYGGVIGELAQQLRDNLDALQLPRVTTQPENDGETGIWAMGRADWEATMLAAFQSEGYLRDPNYCRALAWRNKQVAYLNDRIRAALGHTGDYAIGERLIASEPYLEGRSTIIANSEEVEVYQAIRGTMGDWPIWWLTVEKEDGEQVLVPVLQRSAQTAFDNRQKELSGAKKWGQFWYQREQFAWLAYAYCLTVHKSQGSTFTHGFVDLQDISGDHARHRRERDGFQVYERNQLAYVGATRFEKRLFVLQ